jgi:GntR family transcriptional regulator / MocR family aminotransferase
MTEPAGPVGRRRAPGLLVEIDRAGELPLHEQIERALRERIRSGALPSDTRLPSTRVLAQELGVSRGVVTEAYGQLAAEGYLSTSQGAPVRVARAVRTASPRAPARSLLESFPYHFHPGLPDLAGFPRETWLRSLRSALRDAPLAGVGYGDPRGVPVLREALAGYLGRVRGVDADPEHTLVCTGFMQAFSLLCRTLRNRGVERFALEDPGWHVHRLIVENAGMEVVPIPVDADGLRVEVLAETDAAAVLVTSAPARYSRPSGVRR